jgi:hypothetical protein
VRDIRNIRFQPYRLENSRCYNPSDNRITCIACHDPHRNLITTSISYDSKCLACHRNKGERYTSLQMAPGCPRETHKCVSCHMPKLTLLGAHHAFTDHYIRVYFPVQPYPGKQRYKHYCLRFHAQNSGECPCSFSAKYSLRSAYRLSF